MKFVRIFGLIASIAVLLFSTATPAFAELDTNSNAYRTRNNIIFYDPNDSGQACTASSNSAGGLVGSTNRERAFRYFLSKGLNAEQSAGIVGNLMVESGMMPDNQENSQSWENGGWGIAQWTGGRRTTLKEAVLKAGLPYTNEETPANQVQKLLLFELDYLWSEATTRGDIESLKNETAITGSSNKIIEAAVISWEKHFERAGVPALGARYEQALKAYDAFGGSSSEAGSEDGVTTPAINNASYNAQCASATIPTNGFVYYSQYDPAWATTAYGSTGKTIRSSGCGPTSMAMIVATMNQNAAITPKTIATKYSKHYVPGGGSSHELFGDVAKDYGLESKSISVSQTAVTDALKSGGMVVATGKGSYPFTDSGHIIVIRGLTADGKFLVGNPLPLAKDQSKSSSEAANNTEWFNKGYSWSELSGMKHGYVITKTVKGV